MKNWIKRLIGRAEIETIPHPAVTNSAGPTVTPEASIQTYSSDEPIRSKAHDKYSRWPFAKRIADTLAARKDPSSIVVGLYGPWGDGKTSTLHMMATALGAHPDVVVVQFNPWLFQSEEQLLRGFFATLADAIDRSLPTTAEKIGGVLKRYGSLLSVASIPIGPGFELKPGEAAKGLGESLSEVTIDALRERVERFLVESGKRVVILIDDIDRLDRVETHAILKLVKLSAGFKYTSYVLAFDDEMVAAAIGERYAEGSMEAGRRFLEKIIQVPLHLPPPNQAALRTSLFEGVDAALKTSGITLSQEQIDAFVRHFVDGLEQQLQTPRHAKLYANAIMFALPLLKGEAHPVDLLLMEGIRVFYPKLYKAIRDNSDVFLPGHTDGNRNDPRRQRAIDLIDGALEGRGVQDKAQIRTRLLDVLFPRLKDAGYGREWDGIWEREQRVCSEHYFNRYFTYSVPPGDVGDLEIERLLETLSEADPSEADGSLALFAARNAVSQVIRKLRSREDVIGALVARRLSLAIVRNGSLLPRERAMILSDATFMQAAILTAHLLRRVSPDEDREELAVELARAVEPLAFGFEYFRWVRHNEERPEEERIVTKDTEAKIATALVARIREEAMEAPFYMTLGRDAPRLYWLWSTYGDAADIKKALEDRFASHPDEVDAFLDTYVGDSWGMESGLPSRADFNRGEYDSIAKLVDPNVLVDNLRQRYGKEVEATEFYQSRDVPVAMRIARQFVFIHRAVEKEKEKAEAESLATGENGGQPSADPKV
jgi:hypothetical protein